MIDILPHVVRQPKQPTKNPALLVLLHGYGSNELDLFSFAHLRRKVGLNGGVRWEAPEKKY